MAPRPAGTIAWQSPKFNPSGTPSKYVCKSNVLPLSFLLFFSQYAKMDLPIALNGLQGAGDAVELGKAIAYQKSFWKFIGILALVSIALTVLGVIAAILIPTLISVRG